MVEDFKRVAVIGAGTMGSDLALLFALHDFDVIVCDISQTVLDNLVDKHKRTMYQLRKNKIYQKKFKKVKKRLTLTTKLEDVKDVSFVHENIDEDLDKKRKLFKTLCQQLPDAILATNTSSLKVSDIAKDSEGSERIALMHFSNPPITSTLVEIMKGVNTNEKTLNIIAQVAERIGRTPVILTKDMNGAVLNRVLAIINNEGLWALQNEEATQEEIDASFYRTIGFNLGMTGIMDLVGLDVALYVGVNLAKAYTMRFGPPIRIVMDKVKAGKLGRKTVIGFNDWSKGLPLADKQLKSDYNENRIFAVAANEVFWVIKDELADAKKIDAILKLGFLMKNGLCEIADSIGLDVLLQILKNLHKKYEIDLYKPCPLFEEYIKNGWTGKEAGRGFHTYPISS